MASKKHTRPTVERSFLKLVFLNLLNITKDYYNPQKYPLKPPTENDTVSYRESASFQWKYFFQEHFQKHRAFPETLRQVFR